MMGMAWSCLRGPRLLRIGGGQDYTPGGAESYGQAVLTSLSCALSLAAYTSPILLPWAYRRGWMTEEGGLLITKLLVGVSVVVAGALLLRTLGRLSNPEYRKFATILEAARRDWGGATRAALARYDFHFSAWPVDFDVREVEGGSASSSTSSSSSSSSSLHPMDGLAWLLTHSFGISLVYPGSMALMGMAVERPLVEGRARLLQGGGARHKVLARDGNQIDTMFVQQRSREHGSVLVICCEGNAGFYEIGMLGTAVSAGYSVLGWNHPGFSGSTGAPYPDQEVAAADAVMQFAIHRLGFLPRDILVYGWSIGGFTSSHLAMSYPDIRGLLLDATFDHLEPLAIPRMPASMAPLVSRAVTKFINLNVAEQVAQYPGPVRLLRRNRDEMISTVEGELWSNRGNNLLQAILLARYPGLATPQAMAGLASTLYTPGALHAAGSQEGEERYLALVDREGEEQVTILGYIASKMMTEVDSTHCTPLHTSHFQQPWNPAL